MSRMSLYELNEDGSIGGAIPRAELEEIGWVDEDGEIRVETASVRAREDGTLEFRPFRIPDRPVGVRE